MKAIVFGYDEPTLDLCVWSVERQGFEVVVLANKSSLFTKLRFAYDHFDEDFLRVDADVICNHRIKELEPPKGVLWTQSMYFDWYKQDFAVSSVGYIRKEALPALREHIDEVKDDPRPETRMWRLPEFHNPRRCFALDICVGLHGYGQNNLERIKAQKAIRNQSYDWPLIEKINELGGIGAKSSRSS